MAMIPGTLTVYADGSYIQEYDIVSRYPKELGNMSDTEENIIETTGAEVAQADTEPPTPPPPQELITANDKLRVAAGEALAARVVHITANHNPGKAYKALLEHGVPDPEVVREAIRQSIQPPWREVFDPGTLTDDQATIALLIMGGVWNDGFQTALAKLEEASKQAGS
jgi:hypothetical protein